MSDPIVQSIAGQDGLLVLLNTAFDGFTAINRNPMVQVSVYIQLFIKSSSTILLLLVLVHSICWS